jgi:hypothetical protein
MSLVAHAEDVLEYDELDAIVLLESADDSKIKRRKGVARITVPAQRVGS